MKTERPFDEELKLLKEKLLEMASRAEEQIALAVRGLKDREERLTCQGLEREEATNPPPPKPRLDIPRMAEMAQEMVRDALNAFINGDDKLAKDVCERDDGVDKLNDQVFRELLTYMMQDSGTIARAVDLILVGRHLERIADHAPNVAEGVVYMVRGT